MSAAAQRSTGNPLYCKQDIFIFYIQWLIFLLIGNTMKNTMLRKGLTLRDPLIISPKRNHV
ncbi:TPA: hypothetical protein IFB81_004970 [Escherichia coli]|nr:hypothetical protein [Escherichia coli]EFM0014225.1 hypothetical protein [Escherichia coli]MDN1450972.1 hypothetical protein [Escherichia coli]HAN4030155.1 hypothetical protein [Escherichia coli]HAN4034980.1 hypothetical protein [Escherichia coli]